MTIVPVLSTWHAELISKREQRKTGFVTLAALLCLITAVFLHSTSIVEAQDILAKRFQLLQKRYNERRERFVREMHLIADECESKSFFTDAEMIRTRAKPVDSGAYRLDDLPETLIPTLPLTMPDVEREWRAKLLKTERAYASDIYKIARDALRLGLPSYTFQLVREVAFHDPNNPSARGMLGYVTDKNRWTTPFLRRMSQTGFIDHPRFGWIDSKHVERYENGERFYNSQWMSAEKEAALRTDLNNAWEVTTEHFLVRTNHSLEKGVEIARMLETFHKFFLREYTAFFNSQQQMEKLLDTGTRASWDPSSRYRVTYFRNRDEFVSHLKARQPQIELANGLYLPRDRMAYFFNEEDAAASGKLEETMFHEVTHQLLGESRKGLFDVGERSDFWAVEGFASYMESFTTEEREQQVGDPRHIRIYWARTKIIDENEYRPMREFISLGRPAFPLQAEAYNQSAAMVHFFLNYNDGEYRDAFISYLSDVYNPAKSRKQSLEDLIGARYEALDVQFVDYLKGLPSDAPPGTNAVPFTGTP